VYKQYFGLQKDPFTLTPDPSFLFLTTSHREALAGLTYAVLARKGFVVLTGDTGTGKTTLLAKLSQSIPAARAQFSVMVNPMLSPSEFLEAAFAGFGLHSASSNKARQLLSFQNFLIESRNSGRVCALVVDEAHKLSARLLEEIRLLSNLERPGEKLLQIVLAGQNELRELLNRNDLRQLKQRVAVRLHVKPLEAGEVSQYIRHRWTKAGATSQPPFNEEVIQLITEWSGGFPRLVNAICDNALVSAYGEGKKLVTVSHIEEAIHDLDLSSSQKTGTEKEGGRAGQAAPQWPNGSGLGELIQMPAAHNQAPAVMAAGATPRFQSAPVSTESTPAVSSSVEPKRSSLLRRCAGKLGFGLSQAGNS
jgi:general secretion pathway protein A